MKILIKEILMSLPWIANLFYGKRKFSELEKRLFRAANLTIVAYESENPEAMHLAIKRLKDVISTYE